MSGFRPLIGGSGGGSTLPDPVTIAHGGTGQLSAAAAFAALIAGTTISIAQGGTGQTTVVASRDALQGTIATIASATTTDLSTATGEYSIISGSVTITSFGTVAAGGARVVRFSGAPIITHNASSLILPGAANITAAAGDVMYLHSLGSGNWRCTSYLSGGAVPYNADASALTAGTLALARGGTGQVTAAAALAALSVGSTIANVDPWFTSTYAVIQTLSGSTLTNVTLADECGKIGPQFQENHSGTGLGSLVVSSAIDIISGASSSGDGIISNLNAEKLIPNLRTSPFALAVRVAKLGTNHANTDLRIANAADNVSTNAQIGIVGATSTTNYTLRVGGSASNTGVAQSAAGTFDTLILWNDGTNYHAVINGVDAVQVASSNAGAVACYIQLRALNGATATSSGFRLDKIMLVQPVAT